MIAIIETGGKQYIVSENQKLKVEKLPSEVGDKFNFDKVLLVSDDKVTTVGKPYVEKAKVEAEVIRQARARKISILRYHNKTRRRRRKGHRQYFTEIKITGIKK